MNIFILDEDKTKSAQFYVDRHVVKIILEATQLLCNKHYAYPSMLNKIPYSLTHRNHPLTHWVCQTEGNYMWLCEFALELCKEYTYRYGRIHKCESIIKLLKENSVYEFPKKLYTTPHYLAMPEKYKNSNPVKAYRDYYNGEKRHLFKWTKRKVPQWIKNEI
jgi:hypothetical protein